MRLLLAGFLAFIGLRLLAPFPAPAIAAGVAFLAALYAVMPKGWHAPEHPSEWRTLLPWIAMGVFSWLFVLAIAREALLLVNPELARETALGVWIAVPLITFAGFVMARRTAPVKRVTIRVPGARSV